jgi:DNA-binding NtrC family response regulator
VVLLERHDWPGKVRELKQTIACASFLADGSTITDVHIEKALKGNDLRPADISPVMDPMHRRELLALPTEHAGDVSAVKAMIRPYEIVRFRRSGAQNLSRGC